jgi:hypothetical protein
MRAVCHLLVFLEQTEQPVQLVEELVDDPRFVHDRAGTILTLGPDTEPFKTPRSNWCALLTELLPLGNPIQFSTKEVLPIEIRDAPGPAQIVVLSSGVPHNRRPQRKTDGNGRRGAGVAVDACGPECGYDRARSGDRRRRSHGDDVGAELALAKTTSSSSNDAPAGISTDREPGGLHSRTIEVLDQRGNRGAETR